MLSEERIELMWLQTGNIILFARAIEAEVTKGGEPVKPLRPNCYWKPDDCEAPFDCFDDSELLCDLFSDEPKLGDEYELSEAHYFPAKFRITKVPNDESDDYEVERIEWTDIYTTPQPCPMCEAHAEHGFSRQHRIQELEAELAEAKKDAERYRWLIEQCGSYHDGSETAVKLYQDDATRSCFIQVGRETYGTDRSTFNGIIDAAMRGKEGE